MINVAHGISFFIDLGLSGWPHEPGRAANRPLGGYGRQLLARVNRPAASADPPCLMESGSTTESSVVTNWFVTLKCLLEETVYCDATLYKPCP